MRYFRFTLAGLTLTGLTATGLFIACRDSTNAREPTGLQVTDPAMTMAVGFTSTPVARGNAGTFHIQSKFNGYYVEIKAKDNTDLAVSNIVIPPRGHSGWHSHPGPVFVVVKTGTITFYHGDDPSCSPNVHPAGTVFFDGVSGNVGIARNEGTVEATGTAIFFAPAIPPGSPSNLRIDQPAPGNCSF